MWRDIVFHDVNLKNRDVNLKNRGRIFFFLWALGFSCSYYNCFSSMFFVFYVTLLGKKIYRLLANEYRSFLADWFAVDCVTVFICVRFSLSLFWYFTCTNTYENLRLCLVQIITTTASSRWLWHGDMDYFLVLSSNSRWLTAEIDAVELDDLITQPPVAVSGVSSDMG